jgi:hypothetical protein
MAPSLDASRLTFRKVDLDGDGEPELLVEYIDLVQSRYRKQEQGRLSDESFMGPEGVTIPYLSMWLLRFDGTVYRPTHVGPFLVGQVWAQAPFGQRKDRAMLFVRHESCTECHPSVYLSVVDFLREPNGALFEFTYATDHKDFDNTIEYVLPGMGHSVDAKVETRVLPASSEGPHLLQQFLMDDGKVEWWIFRCDDLKCDYEMFLGALPSRYRPSWQAGRKL